MEAIAQAGDLGVYGKRNNIMLIREDATGQKHVVRLNLNDAKLAELTLLLSCSRMMCSILSQNSVKA